MLRVHWAWVSHCDGCGPNRLLIKNVMVDGIWLAIGVLVTSPVSRGLDFGFEDSIQASWGDVSSLFGGVRSHLIC